MVTNPYDCVSWFTHPFLLAIFSSIFVFFVFRALISFNPNKNFNVPRSIYICFLHLLASGSTCTFSLCFLLIIICHYILTNYITIPFFFYWWPWLFACHLYIYIDNEWQWRGCRSGRHRDMKWDLRFSGSSIGIPPSPCEKKP